MPSILFLFLHSDGENIIISTHEGKDPEQEAWAILSNAQTTVWKDELGLGRFGPFNVFDKTHVEFAKNRLINSGWKSPVILGKLQNCIYTLPHGCVKL